MPKHEAGTPKAIANKIKSKGLQKLRWFCQMCNKQCRDQNGFKCHLMSESHQRQLLLFAETPKQYMAQFNAEFERNYLDILRRQFGTKRILANVVYQEYIKDKNHVHMNSTSWHTLTGFVNCLARRGICKVDQTEKGWFIQYVDPEEEQRREKAIKKQRMDRTDDELIQQMVERQAERALALGVEPDEDDAAKYTELLRADDAEKVGFALSARPTSVQQLAPVHVQPAAQAQLSKFELDTMLDVKPNIKDLKRKRAPADRPSTGGGGGRGKSALDEIREAEERRKERANRRDHWLHEGIVVKVVGKRLPHASKRKAVVKQLVDDYTADVQLLDDAEVTVRVEQSEVETVIPAIGRRVLLVNGAYRGRRATVDALDTANFAVAVTIDDGPANGRRLPAVPYEDLSKLHRP